MVQPIVTLDFRGFQAALRKRLAATKRTVPEVVNKASRNVCLRSVQFTQGANPTEIKAALTTSGTVCKLLQSRAFAHRLPKELAAKVGTRRTRAELIADAQTLIAQRRRSCKNIAAGWIKAAQVFGGALQRKVSDKGLAGHGTGKLASVARPVAEGTNAAAGAVQVGTPALQKALDFVGKDLVPGAQKTLAKTFNR